MHLEPTNGVADLSRANERKRDAALLRATTELFVLDVTHDRDEIRRYEELASHLLLKVSTADRAFVAERLAICGDAPHALISMLARDAIQVASPVLQRSSVLKPIDLLSVIAATGPEHHRMVARRPALAADVRRALKLTGDGQVLANLDDGESMPEKITSNDPTPSTFGRAGSDNAGPPRNGLDPWWFLGLDRRARFRVIAEIASRPISGDEAGAGIRAERAFRSILSAARIVGFARSGQVAAIMAATADGLDLPTDLVAAALNDRGGELLAVMLKALRLDDVQARQVFLLASPSGRDIQTFFPLSDLYAGMEASVAETLVTAWRAATMQPRPRHQPHFAENGDRRRSLQPEPSRHIRPDEAARRA